MELEMTLIAAGSGYLIGSISFARLVVRLLSPEKDITKTKIPVFGEEEGYQAVNIGANVAVTAVGSKAGALVGVLDILKVVLPVLAFRLLFPGQFYFLIAALAGMAGHNWPVYHRFHGGSGFSAALGGVLVIDPLAALVTPVAALLLGIFIFRSYVVASLGWMWLLIPWLWLRTHEPAYVIYAIAVNLLFVIAMIPEARVMLKYRREGKLLEYGLGNLQSSSMGRGMIKMAKWFHIDITR